MVFFPTVAENHLGILVQGAYRTMPSRDNIPPGEPWNQHLLEETSSLLVEAMRWLLDRENFPKDSCFAPKFDDGYFSAQQAKLTRTQELCELFRPAPFWFFLRFCPTLPLQQIERCHLHKSASTPSYPKRWCHSWGMSISVSLEPFPWKYSTQARSRTPYLRLFQMVFY